MNRRRAMAVSTSSSRSPANVKIKKSTKRRMRSARIFGYGYNSSKKKEIRRLICYYAVAGTVLIGILIGEFGDWTISLSNRSSAGTKADQSKSTTNYWNSYYDVDMDETQLQPRENIFTTLTEGEKQILNGMQNDFKTLKLNGNLIPCRLDEGDSCFKADGFLDFLRRPTGKYRVLLHNPLPEDRFWCGKRILGGGGTLEMLDYQCDDGSLPYVYSKQQPIELCWNSNSPGKYSGKYLSCSVPCKTNDNHSTVNLIYVHNTKWTIMLSMEGEQYYSEAHVKAAAYRDNIFYATTSFRSEIPVPYFSWNEYNIQHPAVDFHKVIKGASFLARNCDSKNKRENLVSELIETELRVDSLSSCLNNAELPGIDMENKTAIMEQYLFHLAFENQNVDDYITEKLWLALEAGTLPIYLGAKNVKDHVPVHSIIVAEDFDSPQDLAEYLIRLTNDKSLYETYHTWRYQHIDTAFANKYEFTNTHSTCRICKWAYAKRHGLGWNHMKQEVTEPYIDHKTCRNKIGLIGSPFKEYWLSLEDNNEKLNDKVYILSNDDTKSCTFSDANRGIKIDHGAIRRKVYDHDGVTDLIIDWTENHTNGRYVLRLETPIVGSNQPNKVNEFTWWLQDSSSRMYVMASGGEISLSTHKPGMLEILISSSSARVRIFTENVDHFHQKTKKKLSYFGDLMIRDFSEPSKAIEYRIEIIVC